ncbi:Fur family transcriptional regulator [Thalassiella azotivora]
MTAPADADRADAARADATARAVLDRLRSRGHRVTRARQVVVEALAAQTGHPSVDELCAAVEQRDPSVHRATVYRTLERLTDLGAATHVHLGTAGTVYHLVVPGGVGQHLHARCRLCGRVVDLPGDLLDPVRTRLAEQGEFVLDPQHVALSGTCRDCAGA